METNNQEPTKEDVDLILTFLPLLKAAIGQNPDPVKLIKNNNGSYTPSIQYSRLGSDLHELVANVPWRNYDYNREKARTIIQNSELLASASLSDIKNALFTLTRVERFCSGAWESAINDGTFVNLLERLALIRQNMD
jgi:hypothetical protein